MKCQRKRKANSAWIITSGIIGMQTQALAVADLLGIEDVEIKTVKLRRFWEVFAPFYFFGKYCVKEGINFSDPMPTYAICCGRRSIAVGIYLKRHFNVKLIYIQDPRISNRHFDAVICPKHDMITKKWYYDKAVRNVIEMNGTLIRVSEIQKAKEKYKKEFEVYNQRPIIALLLGGPNKVYKFEYQECKIAIDKIVSIAKLQNAKLFINISRRTPKDIANYCHTIANTDIAVYDYTKPTPYYGMLAYANSIIVTSDSVNMLCEAAATNASVYIIKLKGDKCKFDILHEDLISTERCSWFEDYIEFKAKHLESQYKAILQKLNAILS